MRRDIGNITRWRKMALEVYCIPSTHNSREMSHNTILRITLNSRMLAQKHFTKFAKRQPCENNAQIGIRDTEGHSFLRITSSSQKRHPTEFQVLIRENALAKNNKVFAVHSYLQWIWESVSFSTEQSPSRQSPTCSSKW